MTNTSLENVDGRRTDMVYKSFTKYERFTLIKYKATRSELCGNKIEELERELAQAKTAAQENDKRCEDVVRSDGDTKMCSDTFRLLTSGS